MKAVRTSLAGLFASFLFVAPVWANCLVVGGMTRCTDAQGDVATTNHVGGPAGGMTQTSAVNGQGQASSSNVNVTNGGQALVAPAVSNYGGAGAYGAGGMQATPAANVAPAAGVSSAPLVAGRSAVVLPGTSQTGVIAPGAPANALATGVNGTGAVPGSSYNCGTNGCGGVH